ncbi:hypothetical protein CPC08DRAFT_467583 [Agrocybe pediades]|nr:hypothetical protein CPC08DRAFT_467583 [Agrocybe pediades]
MLPTPPTPPTTPVKPPVKPPTVPPPRIGLSRPSPRPRSCGFATGAPKTIMSMLNKKKPTTINCIFTLVRKYGVDVWSSNLGEHTMMMCLCCSGSRSSAVSSSRC